MSGNLNIDLNIVLMKLISFKLYLPSIRVINLLRERERDQFIFNLFAYVHFTYTLKFNDGS